MLHRNRISRKLLIALLRVLSVIVATAPAKAQGAERVVVRGQLLDRANGHPLAAARVAIPSRRIVVYTDARGGFVLPAIPAGTYDVEMERLGYRAVRANLTLEKDDSVVVRLTPEPVVLDALQVFGRSLVTRSERASVGARAFDAALLDSYAGGGNTLGFLEMNAGLRPIACGWQTALTQCAMVRGLPESVAVWIDGLPAQGGLEELRILPPQEVFHVNVYQGGALVEVVTKEYAREEAHHRVRHPLLTYSAMRAYQYQGRTQSMSR